jgi:hypothetical protein
LAKLHRENIQNCSHKDFERNSKGYLPCRRNEREQLSKCFFTLGMKFYKKLDGVQDKIINMQHVKQVVVPGI